MLFTGDDEVWLCVDDDEVRAGIDDEVGWIQTMMKRDHM